MLDRIFNVQCVTDVMCRLIFESSRRQTSAYVEHSGGKRVVMASTREFAIMRHLYRFVQP